MTSLAEQTNRREILTRAAAESWTLAHVGDLLGVTRERARQLFREHRIERGDRRKVCGERSTPARWAKLAARHPDRHAFAVEAKRRGFTVKVGSASEMTIEGATCFFAHAHFFKPWFLSTDHPGYLRYHGANDRHLTAVAFPNGAWVFFMPGERHRIHIRADEAPKRSEWPTPGQLRVVIERQRYGAQRRAA